MSISFVQSVWTVIAMLAFVAIVIWAFSGKRKKDFEEASKLPLDEEDMNIDNRGSHHG